MSELTVSQKRNLVEGLGLETWEEIPEFVAHWRYFEVGRHYVVLCVCNNGEIDFSVDGAWDAEEMPPAIGATILRRLFEEWLDLKKVLKGTYFCTPVITDGKGARRCRMYKRAGFYMNPDGFMYLEI